MAGNYVRSGDYHRAGLVLKALSFSNDRHPLDFLHGGAYLEMAGETVVASELYRRGLQTLAEDPFSTLPLAHRLALLTLEQERSLTRPLALLDRDDAAAARLDLRAAYALQRHDSAQALRLLNEGISQYPDDPVISWLYLRKAEISFASYNVAATDEALFFAINHAHNHPLLVDLITRLWEEAKEFDDQRNLRTFKE